MLSKNKSEPNFDIIETSSRKTDVDRDAHISDFWWVFTMLYFKDNQQDPRWAECLSLTSKQTFDKINRFLITSLVYHTITKNLTFQHILKISQAATKEVGQKVTIVKFDLVVARKGHNLMWQMIHSKIYSFGLEAFIPFALSLRLLGNLCRVLN